LIVGCDFLIKSNDNYSAIVVSTLWSIHVEEASQKLFLPTACKILIAIKAL